MIRDILTNLVIGVTVMLAAHGLLLTWWARDRGLLPYTPTWIPLVAAATGLGALLAYTLTRPTQDHHDHH